MTFLFPVPTPHATTGTGDWVVGIVSVVVFALAVAAALYLANRPAKVKPTIKQMPEESFRKAA
jgi:hypothetical protein